MNIKKLFATLAGVSLFAQTVVPSAGVFGATYSQELQDAYNWAYWKGVTTMSSIDNANMYGAITRAEMAKMLSVYATEVLGLSADESKACNFTDIDSVKGDLHDYIIKSCKLGIMGQGITAFRPYDTLSRAEFGTALSRVLWGNEYEGGTPYYANHLNALKAAGIMNQIANAESTKEVRGYVMLMLMRSEASESDEVDCDDPDILLACLDEDSDKCPAECKEDSNKEENNEKDSDEKVRAGDLDITADGNLDGRLFVGRPSTLDTITLKSSEEVEVTNITLERIGYSSKENIKEVRLEDENGAKIADAKSLDSKGQVKLSIKKDYRKVDGSLVATIVVDTYDTTKEAAGQKELKAGATVGFQVVDANTTAKNLNISKKANTYTAIAFDASKITFSSNPSTKDYNWEAGEYYEVAKFKVTAPEESSILLRGFTFANTIEGNNGLDVRKYFENAEVTIAGEKVSGLKASVNKDDELVVSFKDVEVAAKKKAEVIVKISLADDFDTFGNTVKYQLKDFVAVDGKVESRVAVNGDYPVMSAYTFKWGKIKIANVKLGNVDAAQNSEDIVIAEGTITVPETIKWSFFIEVKWTSKTLSGSTINSRDAIKSMTVSVNGDETDGKRTTTGGKYGFQFNNVEFEKSGKIQFLIDIKDYNTWDSLTIDFWTFKADAFTTLKYEESGKSAKDETSGSISFSKVTIQPSKASLKNNITKDVEFANKATRTEIVFDGTYTAKKGDIELNEFKLVQTRESAYQATNKVTFYVYVDDMKTAVADADAKFANGQYLATNTFNNIRVKAGESVNVRVEAEVEAENTAENFSSYTLGKYKLYIWWEDVNGNSNSGLGDANTVSMKVVEKGSVKVSTSATKQTIIKKANDALIAEFTVKPSNGASSVDLEEISFTLTPSTLTPRDITVKVGDIEEDDTPDNSFDYSMNKEVTSEGVVVRITLDDEDNAKWNIELKNLKVNGKVTSKDFSKQYVEAAVEIVNQKVSNGSTIFTLAVDADSDVDVRNFSLYTSEDSTTPIKSLDKVFEDKDTISVSNIKDKTQEIKKVTYEYSYYAEWSSCSDSSIHTQEACVNDLYTADEAKAHNATLTGAVSTSVKDPTTATNYNASSAATYNAGLPGHVAENDLCNADAENCSKGADDKYYYTAAGAVAHNATLPGAVTTYDIDPTTATNYTDDSAAAYNANLDGAVKAGDVEKARSWTDDGQTLWKTITVTYSELPDYFKIGDDEIKVMNL